VSPLSESFDSSHAMLLYRLLILLLLPVAIGRLLIRSFGEPAYRRHLDERFGKVRSTQNVDVWLHAVSAGETIAAEPLVRALLARSLTVFLTVSTPAGREAAQRLYGNKVRMAYSPYDTWLCVSFFLSRVRPRLALFMETEIWPGWLASLQQRGIPAALINGRLSDKSYQRYARIRGLIKPALLRFALIGCQSSAHRERFLALGATPQQVQALGSIKFDASLPDDLPVRIQEKQSTLGAAPLFLAASTHPGEDAQCLEAFKILRQSFESLRLVLAPRHVTRAQSLLEEAQAAGWRACSTSDPCLDQEVDVFVLDEMGQLLTWYGLASLTFVGGSLVPHGGHNFMEAALVGCPILVGPSLYNFESMADAFLTERAMIQVSGSQSLASEASKVLSEPDRAEVLRRKALAMVRQETGALERTLRALQEKGLLGPTEQDQ
jgi:3-deoxy-D-manno-octulosonic-acid transferase